MLLNRDGAGRTWMARVQWFPEQALRRIDATIQLQPALFALHLGFIHAPRVMWWRELRLAALFQGRRSVLHPALAGRMVDSKTTLVHHLLEVTIA